jgi:hypothetical protein
MAGPIRTDAFSAERVQRGGLPVHGVQVVVRNHLSGGEIEGASEFWTFPVKVTAAAHSAPNKGASAQRSAAQRPAGWPTKIQFPQGRTPGANTILGPIVRLKY